MMNIKCIRYCSFAVITLLLFIACSENENLVTDNSTRVEMIGVTNSVTRSGTVAELEDYVGKSEFEDKDRAVFVKIARTENAITSFTYSDIKFECSVNQTAGVTSIGWSRVKEEGKPDRIYWSDATNPHTFTGYCTPQQGTGEKDFDWKKKTVNDKECYYGSIGDPTDFIIDHIDFRSSYDASNTETKSGNVELCKNDILLTHSEEITAQDAIAKLYFYHGLAQVRVIVNISDFAEGGGDDIKSKVSDMVLEKMLMLYKWNQLGVKTEMLTEDDQSALSGIYGSTNTPAYDQRKDVKLWIPRPNGVGEKSSRIFTFYGLAVPTQIPEDTQSPLSFSFKVAYPDPMKPTDMKDHTYKASIKGIHFDSGKCTTITISLNHKNEKMTVGAQYDDWEFENTPDQGSLKKNSTFLEDTDPQRTRINIIGDETATVDDATWLYIDPTTQKILDVYGNDGSSAKPFNISTADQLLAFAYEVKGGTTDKPRISKQYMGLDNNTHTLSSNFDFTGYTVTLDAGITLQATEKTTKHELKNQKPNIQDTDDEYTSAANDVEWIGIGDTGQPFNGVFNGGVRLISRLYGKPFFAELGPKAHVEELILESVIGINGDGGFAEVNNGVICASKVDGKVTSRSSNKPVGSFVGTNTGLIFACFHIGDLIAENATVVGGLVGENTKRTGATYCGKIVASYNFGKITADKTYKYGVLGHGTEESVYGCFYDKTKASNVSEVAPSVTMTATYPSSFMTTISMIRNSFVGAPDNTENSCLNGIINNWAEGFKVYIKDTQGEEWVNHYKSHYYVSQPASYPYVY